MKPSFVPALVALFAAPVAVSAQDPVVSSLQGLYDITKSSITATADILDEGMYAYRPSDEVRSAGQILAHIANAQFLFCSAAADQSNPSSENFEESATTKAQITAALRRAFAYCDGVFANVSDPARAVNLFGNPNTAAGVLAFNAAHNYEHYGNLVTYMRLNGIVPPSSR